MEMNTNEDQAILLEVYKLHTELAEQVAASREGLNKLYAGMVSSIIAASVLLQRFVPDSGTAWVLPALGALISMCWMVSLISITGRLSAKHAVLVSLESKLPFDFLERENAEFEKGFYVRRKWSSVLMPILFLLVSSWWLVSSLPSAK